ncbi:MAG TPA: Ig-like domain-containing protein [Longimicrobiales bacterium]
MKIFVPLLFAAAAAVFILSQCGDSSTGPASRPRLRIGAPSVLLTPGDSTSLAVEGRDARGQPIAPEEVAWSSSDPGIADVAADGRVTAVAQGRATIVATAEEARDSVPAIVGPAVLVGAGDIASCTVDGDDATAALLDTIPGVVFTLGDHVYPHGKTDEFLDCYAPTWGRHRDRTRPTPGNHDYDTADAAAYFTYFGAAAGEPGKGYYSYDLGSWHIVVLNSEIDTGPDSEQLAWLREDLAAHPALCTLAYWHRPLFSSNTPGGNPAMKPFWDALYEAGAELVLNGHDHYYDRYVPLTPDGVPDPERGIRQFVVGTGGQPPHTSALAPEIREVHDGATVGVLKLTLRPDGYEWAFVPADGGTFTDSGSAPCH